ncbi:MAG TPA: helix-turn-helix domain-containing protein [Anaeromyxobacteraceae bacterium]|nr:helix-turn-helix domain-containing protein [Anaeromyxobacteraceae bacterium]
MARRIDEAVELTAEDRAILEAWVARPPSSGLSQRARIVLGCEGARSDAEVGRALGVSARTVRSWRARFRSAGPAGLFDAPRLRSGRRVDEGRRALVRGLALGEEEAADPGPSTRAAAAAGGVSQSTVCRIWRDLGVAAAPRRADPLDVPAFVGGECDLAGVLLAAPDRMAAFVLRSPARGRGSPRAGSLPPQIAELSARVAERMAPLSGPRRAVEAWRFLDSLEARAPAAGELHLLLADRSTARLPSVRRWSEASPRHRVHLPPAGAAWPEALERWLPWLLQSAKAVQAARELRERLAQRLAALPGAGAPFTWFPRSERHPSGKDS